VIFTDILTIYATVPESYGDPIPGTSYETVASVDATNLWAHAGFMESDGGGVTAWIPSESEAWTEFGIHLAGLLADYDDMRYRIAAARPTGSLLTGELDLIELTLTRQGTSDVG
jgi:hypothetical protein